MMMSQKENKDSIPTNENGWAQEQVQLQSWMVFNNQFLVILLWHVQNRFIFFQTGICLGITMDQNSHILEKSISECFVAERGACISYCFLLVQQDTIRSCVTGRSPDCLRRTAHTTVDSDFNLKNC